MARDATSPQEIQRMRDGEVRWGEHLQSQIDVPASIVIGLAQGEFKHIVRVQDVARAWALHISLATVEPLGVGDTLIARFRIVTGIGSARFSHLPTPLSIVGPTNPAFAVEVGAFLPDYPAETIDIEAALDCAFAAGSARTYHAGLNAAACPYTRLRADT